MKGAFILALLIFAGFISRAQSDLISASYDSASFTDLVRDIESKTKYKFYFADAWVDTLKVTATFTNVPPSTIIEKALQNSLIHYYILGDKIILTQNVPIQDKIDTTLFKEFQNSDASKLNYSFERELTLEEKGGQKETRATVIGVLGKTNSNVAVLSGYIKERKTGESIPGATVSSSGKATTTDQYGYYSFKFCQHE